MKDINRRQLLLAIISAVLIAVPFFSQYGWPLLFIAFIALFTAIKGTTAKQALKIGTLTGTIAYFVTTYWLIGTLSRFGGFPVVIAVLFHLIISTFSGLLFGLFCLLINSDLLKNLKFFNTIIIGIIWVAVEHLYPLLFPFSIASPLANYYPAIQISDLFGIGSLSFVLVVVNHSLYKALLSFSNKERWPVAELALSVILVASVFAYGYEKIGSVDKLAVDAPKLKIGIVQGNFDFDVKKQDNYLTMVQKHQELSYELKDSELIIWPETAIQVFIPTTYLYLTAEGTNLIPYIQNKYFLAGGLSYDPPDPGTDDFENVNKYNSAFLTDAKGKIMGRYHKIKLLMFGEYMPFTKYFPFLQQLSPSTGDYLPGSDLNLMKIPGLGVKIAPLICYEDIIPSFSRQFNEKGANLLVNLTNDAWFGKTIAASQHLLLAVPRAVETRTYLIRATNTGVSAIIDPVGRVVKKSDIFEQQSMSGEVSLMNNDNTFYVEYGYYFYSICVLITDLYILTIARYRWKRKKLDKT